MDAQGKTGNAQLMALLDVHTRSSQPGVCGVDDGGNSTSQHRPVLPLVILLKQVGPRSLQLTLRVPANLLYFDGHFPEVPILPGVVQVDWALYFAHENLAIPDEFCGLQALKFQQVIRPEMDVVLDLAYEETKQSLQFNYSSAAGQHASGRVVFARK